MTENLIDHHYLLTLYKENGEEWFQIRPAINNDIKKRDYFHLPFSEESLEKQSRLMRKRTYKTVVQCTSKRFTIVFVIV